MFLTTKTVNHANCCVEKTSIFLSLHSILVRKKFKVPKIDVSQDQPLMSKTLKCQEQNHPLWRNCAGQIKRRVMSCDGRSMCFRVCEGNSPFERLLFFTIVYLNFCEIFYLHMHECHDATGEEVFFFFCWDVIGWILTWKPSLVGESHRTLAADPQSGGVESFQKKRSPWPIWCLLRKKMSDFRMGAKKNGEIG